MSLFRIIKSETSNLLGETDIKYRIQKKFLFWFFDCAITTHYNTITHWNANHKNEPTHQAMLINRIFLFNTEQEAKKILEKIKNPFKLRYKGDKIIVVFNDNYRHDVFINKSYWGWALDNKIGYEFSDDLDELKKMIDKRKIKIKTSVVG